MRSHRSKSEGKTSSWSNAWNDAVLLLGAAGILTTIGMLHYLWVLAFLAPGNIVVIQWNSVGEFWMLDTPILILMTVFPILLLLRAWRDAQ